MTVHLLRAGDRLATPWKNGGGATREIAAYPPGSDVHTFDWRVSTAEVASDGPFSRFEGIDRTLMLPEGAGLSLRIDGGPVRRLLAQADPLSFPGDVGVEAALLEGPITDLNVMVRRGVWSSRVQRRHIEARTTIVGAAEVSMVMALGEFRLGCEGEDQALSPADVARLDRYDTISLQPLGAASQVIVVELFHPAA